ncbi:MAG: hypothetical protein RBG1_1C00001G1104 [candidate division Zixibacteria bacterium RBG-1]|nr:MAG: hypothetical protein RBG1_1C00001G1104 [candidate division Zixibacteria bacterium RBG-1]OGC83216.1 MAG: hypothetical protein A2V73_06880 [candidate division Zixibacteria bacterium RBG_19FT_COMBO_42_43]
MKKIFSITVLFSLLLMTYFVVTAQQDTTKVITAPTPLPSKAKILVPNTDWDYGYMPKGIKVSHIYKIQNLGEDTLRITSVKPSCGCTSAPLKKNNLAPGEATDLEVSFDSKNMMGKVSKSVTINSDDPTTPSLVLHFTSNVGIESPIVRFTPVEVLYDSVQVGKNDTRKILLFNTDITKVDLAFVDKPKEMVAIDLKKSNLEPGKSTEMIFRVDKNATPGYFNLCSTLEINGSDKYRVTIPISGTLVAK